MSATVDQILRERLRLEEDERRRQRKVGVATAALLHAALLAVLVVGAYLGGPPRRPLEFVSVQVVPVQALGSPRPAPQRRREPTRPPKPKPEPPSKPKPEPKAAPSLPSPEAKKEPPSEPPTPKAEEEPAAHASDEASKRAGSPQGNAAGTSPLGTTAVAGLDNPDFRYDYYIDRMLGLIASNWVRPTTEGKIEAVVHFRIARNGRLSGVELVQTSGFRAFDLAALRAVESSDPLPPLPAGYAQDSLGVTLIVR